MEWLEDMGFARILVAVDSINRSTSSQLVKNLMFLGFSVLPPTDVSVLKKMPILAGYALLVTDLSDC